MGIHGAFAIGALAVGVLFSTARAEAAVPEQVLALDPALGQLPESMAVDDRGNFYLSMGSQVAKVSPSLAVTTLATLPIPAGGFATGVKFGPRGDLFVAAGAFDPSLDSSYVFKVDKRTGSVAVVADLDPDGFPNDLAFDDSGAIFLTDSALGVIWKVRQGGAASIWLSDPLLQGNPNGSALGIPFGANGIAFDQKKRKLYVSNTDLGAILEIRVLPSGAPGDVEVFAADSRLVGADGIAFDRSGTLYVAVNTQDRLAAVDKRGRVSVVAQAGLLDGPSSLAFGVGHCDRHTLFLTNFAISRASGSQPGVPNPGILSVRVSTPGLPLP
ncbi:MAG TPA: SMP-30/gluconolactonase/LRE family protein [Polyangiaceae bacterium]|nr:SMP-30/gluconolactonase/LRE family protein [Polyangiaceae bacterium]